MRGTGQQGARLCVVGERPELADKEGTWPGAAFAQLLLGFGRRSSGVESGSAAPQPWRLAEADAALSLRSIIRERVRAVSSRAL